MPRSNQPRQVVCSDAYLSGTHSPIPDLKITLAVLLALQPVAASNGGMTFLPVGTPMTPQGDLYGDAGDGAYKTLYTLGKDLEGQGV